MDAAPLFFGSTLSPTEPVARIEPDGRAQPLTAHLLGTGERAETFGSKFGAGDVCRVSGVVHDVGKVHPERQALYREEHARGVRSYDENDDRDHATAGALLLKEMGDKGLLSRKVASVLAYGVAGHHAGLSNPGKLRTRFAEKKGLLEACKAVGLPVTVEAYAGASLPSWVNEASRTQLELLIRMISSVLVDADRLDAEAFSRPLKIFSRQSWRSLKELRLTFKKFIQDLEQKASPSPLNKLRSEVRKDCLKSAGAPPGVFSLSLPPGYGKTNVAMEFGLDHAELHGKDRIIVLLPFTSVITQTAECYRKAFGPDAVLEHHSDLGPAQETEQTKCASENWDAPIIVTTFVQFLESLLSNKPSKFRKIHNIARCVLVVDEAQGLPIEFLSTILDVLTALVRDYGVTIVFSTATQPAFRRSKQLPQGFAEIKEIVPNPSALYEKLKRVQVRWPSQLHTPVTWGELAKEVRELSDVLVIVHQRKDVQALTQALDAELGDTSTLPISRLMCSDHCAQRLKELRASRAAGKHDRVVATPLMEAGVDMDFPIVYRALAGDDSLAQAAGRSNREGLLVDSEGNPRLGELRVFLAPSAAPSGVLSHGLGIVMGWLMSRPEFRQSWNLPETFREYFSLLYGRDLDLKQVQKAREALDFPETAERFRLIDDDWSAEVVVPWADSEQVVKELLNSLNEPRAWDLRRRHFRRLQKLTVSVSKSYRERLIKEGYATEIKEAGIVVLDPKAGLYDPRWGLKPG